MRESSKLENTLDAVCTATASRAERLQKSWSAVEPFIVSAVQESVRRTAADAASIANSVGIPLPGAAAERASTSAAAAVRFAGRTYVSGAQTLASSVAMLRSAASKTQA